MASARIIAIIQLIVVVPLWFCGCIEDVKHDDSSFTAGDGSREELIANFKRRYDAPLLRFDDCGNLMRAGGHLIACRLGDEEQALQKGKPYTLGLGKE
jgi:hypothetical protein